MSKLDNYIDFDGELVRVSCSGGHVYVGKCHFYSELNNDDDLSVYARVNKVMNVRAAAGRQSLYTSVGTMASAYTL